MRLLMISDRYPPETRSVAHIFQDLAEALVKRGHKVTVLTKRPPGEYLPVGLQDHMIPVLEIVGGVTVVRVGGLFSSKMPAIFRALDQFYLAVRILLRIYFAKPKPDAVLVYSPPLPLAIAAALYRRWAGVAYVLNLHDLYPRTAIELGLLKNKFVIWAARNLERIAYTNADHIVVPAAQSRQILIEDHRLPLNKVELVFNWIDTDGIVPGAQDNAFALANGLSGQFVASYAGLMGYAQDLSTIIECAWRLRERRDLLFLLVGDGVCVERWKCMSAGLENVRFLPAVPREVYLDILRASDVCLVPLAPSLHSPAIPGKLQSIMAVGKPVIAIVPTGGDAARMVSESRCGFVVTPGDTKKLESRLMELFENPDLAKEFGANGRRYAETHFRLDAAASTVERVLLQVIRQ